MSTALYLIPEAHLPPGTLEGIPYLHQRVGCESGITIPAEYRDQLIQSITPVWGNVTPVELPTCDWSIRLLLPMQLACEPVTIICHEPVSPAWEEYLAIVADTVRSASLPYPAVIHYASQHQPRENGKVHVCFGGQASFPIRVWAAERDVFYQSCNIWIGELGPEHVACRDLVKSLLPEFLPCILGLQKQHGEAAFISTSREASLAEISRLNEEAVSMQQRLQDLELAYVKAIRGAQKARDRVLEKRSYLDQATQRLERSLAEIASREYVEAISFEQNVISVITKRVAISVPRRIGLPALYDIGTFHIYLDISAQTGCVKIFNLTRSGPTRFEFNPGTGRPQHPHVDGAGNACFGDIRHVIPQYIAQWELAAALDLIYKVLSTANLDDTWGRTVTYWPEYQRNSSPT